MARRRIAAELAFRDGPAQRPRSLNGRSAFEGRLAIQQRLLPAYRAPFFDSLASVCSGGLEIFAGSAPTAEGVQGTARPDVAAWQWARNRHMTRGSLYVCWQQGLTAWLRRTRPDVLIVEANPRLISNYSAIRLMKTWHRPVIGWGLGVQDWAAPKWVLAARRRILRRFCSQFDLLITYSSKGARDYQSLGVPQSKVVVAPNSVSSEGADRLSRRLEEDPGLVQAWKARLGLSDRPTILFVGRLVPQKRVADLIRACAEIANLGELLIVGDGPERPKLESLARWVLPGTRFLGHRTGDDLGMCFAAADLFVQPGSGGLSLQEAMIFGKAVVVSSGDGTEVDLVKEGQNGFHVPAGDVSALAKTIGTQIEDPARLKEMGQRSRRTVEDGHNLDAMVGAFLDALELASSRQPAAAL